MPLLHTRMTGLGSGMSTERRSALNGKEREEKEATTRIREPLSAGWPNGCPRLFAAASSTSSWVASWATLSSDGGTCVKAAITSAHLIPLMKPTRYKTITRIIPRIFPPQHAHRDRERGKGQEECFMIIWPLCG